MKNILNRKIPVLFLLVLTVFVNAQKTSEVPPPPQNNDIGALSQPIDNYIILLMLVAVFVIGYFARKYKTASNSL